MFVYANPGIGYFAPWLLLSKPFNCYCKHYQSITLFHSQPYTVIAKHLPMQYYDLSVLPTNSTSAHQYQISTQNYAFFIGFSVMVSCCEKGYIQHLHYPRIIQVIYCTFVFTFIYFFFYQPYYTFIIGKIKAKCVIWRRRFYIQSIGSSKIYCNTLTVTDITSNCRGMIRF